MISISRISLAPEHRKALLGLLAIVILVIPLLVLQQNDSNHENEIPSYKISKESYDREVERLSRFFKANKQSYDTDTIERDVRQGLIDKLIVEEYARQNDITVNENILDSYYAQRVEQFSSEDAFLSEIDRLYGMDKESYVEILRYDLLREAVQARLNQPLSEWLSVQRKNSQLVIEE